MGGYNDGFRYPHVFSFLIHWHIYVVELHACIDMVPNLVYHVELKCGTLSLSNHA